jgi:CTP synthase
LGRNCLCVHLTYVPYIAAAKEVKTKPTQHSIKMLQEQGIQPEVLVLRTEKELDQSICHKVALFCNVEEDAVFQSYDVPSIYEVPVVMAKQRMDEIILQKMNMPVDTKPEMKSWLDFLKKMQTATQSVKIGLVGKYVELPDAYKSINESLLQAATYHNRKLDLQFIHSEKLNDQNVAGFLSGLDGILVAPGFGQRGIEGKFVALKYARENDVPTLGVCLGMQCMVVEFARNILHMKDANSTEMDSKTPYPVIDLMEEQKNLTNMGGSMRLGAYECSLQQDSKVYKSYNKELVQERHRHRYEFNNKYKSQFEKAGMKCVGTNPETGLVEVIEIPKLKWYVGVQFHPEYNSTVVNPNPLFLGFVSAAIEETKTKIK